MSPDFWVPGTAEPSLDAFVDRVHSQIERYTATHTAEQTHVVVELGDGERLTLHALSGEPGFGFLTLSVSAGDGDAEELTEARDGEEDEDQNEEEDEEEEDEDEDEEEVTVSISNSF